MKLLALLLAFTPSFIHVRIRRLMGSSIDKGSKIKIGTILISKKLKIGKNVNIGPLAYISSKEIKIDDFTKIKALSVISASKIELGKYVHISPLAIINGTHTENSFFKVGDHSRFFPFCWIETGEGVEIGNQVGVGGHTLIFTHGVWSDYLNGGPVSYGPVKIKDNVWLPWRVFIMPNVTIGENSIIGANSTVNKSIPDNVIAAGSPAKIVKDDALTELSIEQKVKRAKHILIEFSKYINYKYNLNTKLNNNILKIIDYKIIIDDIEEASKNDLVFIVNNDIKETEISFLISKGISLITHFNKNATILNNNLYFSEFISFLRRFGIRLYIINK